MAISVSPATQPVSHAMEQAPPPARAAPPLDFSKEPNVSLIVESVFMRKPPRVPANVVLF